MNKIKLTSQYYLLRIKDSIQNILHVGPVSYFQLGLYKSPNTDCRVRFPTFPRYEMLKLGALLVLAVALASAQLIHDSDLLSVHQEDLGISWSLHNTRGRLVLRGTALGNAALPEAKCADAEDSLCRRDAEHSLSMRVDDSCLDVYTTGSNPDEELMDCFDLEDAHWFGGPEQWLQLWPMEKLTWDTMAYVPVNYNNMAVAERYFLSSRGVYLTVDPNTPLFVDLNSRRNNSLCLVARNEAPYTRRTTVTMSYSVCGLGAANAKEAHLEAVQDFLGKPIGLPNDRTVRHPIWSTWARYKQGISQGTVMEFATEILDHGFNNSALEIDDNWETCYGALEFDTSDAKFPDPRAMSSQLKDMGFRVTLWIHPFINRDCQPHYDNALANGDLITNAASETVGSWWNGAGASVDFTRTAAATRWADKLRALQTDQLIDSFKFDAGENGYAPQVALLNASDVSQPAVLTQRYVELCSTFGDYVEVRSAARTQSTAPIFLRMLDKDSRWGLDNGLRTLVTTLLQMNMVGYPLVLPDMIGGNGYGELPTKELFIRWLQANVFMPSLQFSFVPWDYDQETIDLSLRFVQLHAEAADRIMALAAQAIEDGSPINPPVWWLDPEDVTAQALDDEFLLGSEILVAPVLDEGATSRNIYLPRGLWLDNNSQAQIQGPIWLIDYNAPLDTLPYFTLISA